MKKYLLGPICILFYSLSYSQSTVTFTQQTNYYYNNVQDNPPVGAFSNPNGSTVSMITNVNTNSDVVAWRKFNTAPDNTGSNRSMQIGDKFAITVNANRAKGEIGVALLASPSNVTYSDRTSNYAVSVNLDGPDSLGGSNYGNWYVRYANGDTLRASFGGVAPASSAHDFKIEFKLTAADRMNITITDVTSSVVSRFYDIHLNTSNPITDYSIYLSDADGGTGVAKKITWKQFTTITNTGSVSLDSSNLNYTISSPLTNGSDVISSASFINNFAKDGTGNITLSAASTYTGTTSLNSGSLIFGIDNALPITTPGNIILDGGTIKSGASSGFNLGSSINPAGTISLINNSIIALGTGSHSIYFANSSASTWLSKTLTITGWVGTVAGGGTSGKIFVGNNGSGLTGTQLSQITFTGYGTGAQFNSGTGELKPIYDAYPTTAASNLTFTNVLPSQVTVNFTPGNGTGGRIVVASEASPPGAGPVNGQTYTANTIYGNGDAIGSGSVVYATTGSASSTQTFTVTGLNPGSTYYFDIYEYNGSGTSASYGLVYEGSQLAPSSYQTVADGNWETNSTWNCNCQPPSNYAVTIQNNVTLTQNETTSDITINSGKTLADGGFTLNVTSSIINNGTLSGAGKIKFSGTGNPAISGTGTFNNVEAALTSSGSLNLQSDITIGGTLTITSNTVVIGSNKLTLNGSLAGTGTLTGSSTSNISIGNNIGNISFTNTSASTRSLNNLSLASGSATLSTALDLYGLVSFSGTSTLNLNAQHVTLKSTSTSNATIGNIGTGTLSGATNVTVERYIPNDRRAYRTMAPGVNTSTTINANWQEGATNTTVGTNVDPNPGYGTQISGTGGSVNGFDVTQSNQSSLLTYNTTTHRYVGIGNTNSNTFNAKQGYLMFIRGDRSMDMNSYANPLPTSSTVLRATGTLATGNQSYSVVGNSDGTTGNGYNLISNPYPAFIDWNALYTDINSAGGGTISSSYTYVDPNVGTQGGYVTYNASGNVYAPDPGHTVTNAIQPGQSFFIQAYNGAGVVVPAPIVVIKEAHKLSSGVNSSVFKAETAQQIFRASIYYNETATSRKVIDGVATIFDDKYSFNVDQNDSRDLFLFENIAIVRKGVNLQIEARPSLLPNDTMVLYISGMNIRDYQMELKAENFDLSQGRTAYLMDNYTNTKTNLDLSGTTIVPFSVTSDAATKASNRFYVVFNNATPLPVTLLTFNVSRKNESAFLNWSFGQELNMDKYEIERSINGSSFSLINVVQSKGNSNSVSNYSYLDPNITKGIYYYRLKMYDKNGTVTYSPVAKLELLNSSTRISIYPNPVIGSVVNLHIENLPKGVYPLIISNNLGQVVFQMIINHPGGNASENLEIGGKLSPGIYTAKIQGNVIKFLKQ